MLDQIKIPRKHHEEAKQISGELNKIAEKIRELASVAETSGAALKGAGRYVMELSNQQAELYARLETLANDT